MTNETTDGLREALDDLTRPIIGIDCRSAEEVHAIMCDRIKHKLAALSRPSPVAGGDLREAAKGLRLAILAGDNLDAELAAADVDLDTEDEAVVAVARANLDEARAILAALSQPAASVDAEVVREACARVADKAGRGCATDGGVAVAGRIADAIRALPLPEAPIVEAVGCQQEGGGDHLPDGHSSLDEVARLKARLEVVDGWSEDADGIACRNDTIKLQDERIVKLRDEVARLREALLPFADYADPTGRMPASLPITNGSRMARAQLTMGDCYAARKVLDTQP